jgi:uncharacterized membrane protein YfcA
MDLEWWKVSLMVLLVGFAGFIDAIAGGGGLITVPTYLTLGVPPELVLGTNKCVSSAGTTLAVMRFVRQQLIHWPVAIVGIIAAAVGAFLGARGALFHDKRSILVLLLLLVPAILFLQYRFRYQLRVSSKGGYDQKKYVIQKTILLGLVMGTYDGFFGPGTGTFLLLGMMWFLKMDPLSATAHARLVNYASNLGALGFFLIKGLVAWDIALLATSASLLGNWLGSGLALSHREKAIIPAFRFVLLLLLAKCVWDLGLDLFGGQ